MNDDGTMARVPQLMAIAERFHLKIVTIKDLIHHRMQRECLVRVLGETTLPLRVGTFRALAFENEINQDQHLVLVMGTFNLSMPRWCGCILLVSRVMSLARSAATVVNNYARPCGSLPKQAQVCSSI